MKVYRGFDKEVGPLSHRDWIYLTGDLEQAKWYATKDGYVKDGAIIEYDIPNDLTLLTLDDVNEISEEYENGSYTVDDLLWYQEGLSDILYEAGDGIVFEDPYTKGHIIYILFDDKYLQNGRILTQKEFNDIVMNESLYKNNKSILMEDINALKQSLSKKLTSDEFDTCIRIDPTYNGGNEIGKYGKVVLKLLTNIKDDEYKYNQWLKSKELGYDRPEPQKLSQDTKLNFDKIAKLLQVLSDNNIKVDPNKINSMNDLRQIVDNIGGTDVLPETVRFNRLFDKAIERGAEEFYEDDYVRVIIPATKESECLFGKDSNWCTTVRTDNSYESYMDCSQLYTILNKKTGKIYQISFGAFQFCNAEDKDVPYDEIFTNAKTRENLAQMFIDDIETINVGANPYIPEYMVERVGNVTKSLAKSVIIYNGKRVDENALAEWLGYSRDWRALNDALSQFRNLSENGIEKIMMVPIVNLSKQGCLQILADSGQKNLTKELLQQIASNMGVSLKGIKY